MNNVIQYTREMYEYLAWRLFQKMYGETDFVSMEKNRIDEFVESARKTLTKDQVKIVDNHVVRMKNDYKKLALESFREENRHER